VECEIKPVIPADSNPTLPLPGKSNPTLPLPLDKGRKKEGLIIGRKKEGLSTGIQGFSSVPICVPPWLYKVLI
jgi:hypothetical protein